jgi:hypothetical protein
MLEMPAKKAFSSLYKVTLIIFGFDNNWNLLVNSSKILRYQIMHNSCVLVVIF